MGLSHTTPHTIYIVSQAHTPHHTTPHYTTLHSCVDSTRLFYVSSTYTSIHTAWQHLKLRKLCSARPITTPPPFLMLSVDGFSLHPQTEHRGVSKPYKHIILTIIIYHINLFTLHPQQNIVPVQSQHEFGCSSFISSCGREGEIEVQWKFRVSE